MSNSFKFTISAVDKATATVRKVNDEVSRLGRPFQQVGQSLKNLGKELGFQRLGKNLASVGREARTTASGVASIVAPLAAVTGVGSIAGVIALADSWARLGRSTSNTSANIGINAGELQKFQGAATLAGLSAEDMTGSLQGLATTMENAAFGRDNQALMLMNRLGVGIKRTGSGAMDAAGEFKALAAAIAKMKDPQQQMLAAQKFGMQALLPLIRQGPEAFDQLAARAEAMGLVMSGPALKSATDFANSLDNLQGAGTGLKNSIAENLTPAIKPLVDELAGWIIQNRELIGQDIGAWARDVGKWLESVDWKGVGENIRGFVDDAGKVVDALGGWKGAAITLGVVMNAGLIASVATLGVSLLRGAVGILAYIGLLRRWSFAAKAAAASTIEANAAAAASSGGAVKAGLVTLGVVGASLALKGDESESSQDARVLQDRAMAGDRGAAVQLAKTQLNHWWRPKPTDEEVEKRADDISSGRQAGYSPELMAKLHPEHAAAEKRLTELEKQYSLPPGLLDKVWKQESSRGANMLSGKGAKGHFGFMDPTAQQYGVANPNDFNQSSEGAAKMFRDLLKQYGGDMDKALAAYNWGQGNLDKKGLAAAPKETRDYIRDVRNGMAAEQAPADQPPARVATGSDRANDLAPTPAAQPSGQAQAAPEGPYSNGNKPDVTRHAFDVTFNGLPSGASVKAKSDTGGDMTPRIGRSAVGAVV